MRKFVENIFFCICLSFIRNNTNYKLLVFYHFWSNHWIFLKFYSIYTCITFANLYKLDIHIHCINACCCYCNDIEIVWCLELEDILSLYFEYLSLIIKILLWTIYYLLFEHSMTIHDNWKVICKLGSH